MTDAQPFTISVVAVDQRRLEAPRASGASAMPPVHPHLVSEKLVIRAPMRLKIESGLIVTAVRKDTTRLAASG